MNPQENTEGEATTMETKKQVEHVDQVQNSFTARRNEATAISSRIVEKWIEDHQYNLGANSLANFISLRRETENAVSALLYRQIESETGYGRARERCDELIITNQELVNQRENAKGRCCDLRRAVELLLAGRKRGAFSKEWRAAKREAENILKQTQDFPTEII